MLAWMADFVILIVGIAVFSLCAGVLMLLCMRGWRDFRWSQRDRIIHSALVIMILGPIAIMAGIGAYTVVVAAFRSLVGG